MRYFFLALAAVLLLYPNSAVGRQTSALSAFHTPGKAAECFIPFGAETKGPDPLHCWTPNDGFSVTMLPTGRASKKYDRAAIDYHDYFSGRHRLGFGQDWSWSFDQFGIGRFEYLCQSRSTGLTCKNSSGHGWWLGRYKGYRLF